jgi:zinc protease
MRSRCRLVLVLLSLTTSASVAQTTLPVSQPVGRFGTERYRVVSEPDEVVTVLENGMTVIAKRVASPVVAVRGHVKTGGVYEGKWLGGGLSHLLEHLVAGGSTEKRTEAENRTILQDIGNNSNAYTSDDETVFFINTTPSNMEKAVDLLTGWLLGARITPDEYAREFQVVQRELEMGKGEPDRQFYYLQQLNRYRQSPARVPVIGYQSVIQSLSRDDVYAYFKLAYQPQNITISIAGDLDPETTVSAVRTYVGDVAPGREFSHEVAPEPPVLSPRTVVATAPKLGQAKLNLSFPTVRLDHPDLYALDLLAACLSDGDSAILVRTLRDERQLVSGVSAWSFTPAYVEGSFSVSADLDTDKVAAMTKATLDLIEKVKKEGVDDDTILRARTRMKVSRVRATETADDIASSLANDWMSTGDVHFSDKYLERVDKVTNDDLKRVAIQYLDANRLVTTAMLPEESTPKGLPSAVDVIRAAAPTTQVTEGAKASDQVVKTVLGDGTILLTKRLASSKLVSIRMYTIGGVSVEDASTNGIGNLTMRMLPRGTTTRSVRQIAEFFDSVGGDLSTSAGNNSFSWSASCLTGDVGKVVDVLADVVYNPAFDEKELAAMKTRLSAAIDSQDDDWTSQAFRFFRKAYFGPTGSPYQFTALGTKQNVGKFDAKALRDWYTSRALVGTRVLAIFGDVSTEAANALARKLEGPGDKPRPAPTSMPTARPWALEGASRPSVTIARVETNKTRQPLAGIVIGYDAADVVGMPDSAALDVADTMASGFSYPTGYLHETLRGQGLVYVVHGAGIPGRSPELPGTWIVYAGCDPANVDKVVDEILLNIARLQGTDGDLQAGWIDRAKNLMLIDEAMDRQTAAQQAEAAAINELYGLGHAYPDGFAGRVAKVDTDAVRSVARRRLAKCVVTVSTPKPELVTVKTGEKAYEKFPPVDLAPKGVAHDVGGGGH